MALPVQFLSGYVALIAATSANNISIVPPENPNTGYIQTATGQVDGIGIEDSWVVVGDIVLFIMTNVITVSWDGTTYYLVQQSDIIFVEDAVS